MIPALLIGFIASVALSAVGLIARLANLAPFPAEKLYNWATYQLGVPALFQLVHKIFGFGEGGKIFAFVGVLFAWVGGLTLLGLVPPMIGGLVVAVISLLFVNPIWALVYGLLYIGLRTALSPVQTDPKRRGVLNTLSLASLGLFGAGVAGALRPLFTSSNGNTNATTTLTNSSKTPLLEGLTSQDDFYYVSINNEALDPRISESNWKLEVNGLVKTPQKFALADLKAFKPVDLELTICCISNPIGGDLIGNAIWTGLKFKDLMDKVGVQPGAKWVTWEAEDGFYESIALRDALEQDVMLAYQMNGEALNYKHGFPLRVIIPGRFGMKQPRWLTKITFTAEEKPGYWANRGWSKTAFIAPLSRIDYPTRGLVFKPGEVVKASGIAAAGNKQITKVEVSTDGGDTWLEATLQPKRSKWAWTQWTLDWTAEAGTSDLGDIKSGRQFIVRCYADGVVQASEERDSLPEAASGLHRLTVSVPNKA
jgi:DMSO/TMAO reductase YedYZ molybdopterin-dependent catalytic subunit